MFFKRISMILGLSALAVSVYAQGLSQPIGQIEFNGYDRMSMTKISKTESQWVITGPRDTLSMCTVDGKFFAKASKLVITFTSDAKGRQVPGTAKLSGNVEIVAKPELGRETTARAPVVDVVWGTSPKATLTGGMWLETCDPTIFVGPATLTAESAVISLKRDQDLLPGETRLEITGDPSKTHLAFTPLPSQAADQSKKPEQK